MFKGQFWTTTLTALAATSVVGCIEPWEAGVIGVEKHFRVPVDAISVEPPTPDLETLVGEDGMAVILETAGMPRSDIEEVQGRGVSLLELQAVHGIIPLDAYDEDIEVALISAMEDSLERSARESLEGHDVVTNFDSDWSAWDTWTLDRDDPNGSLARGLVEIPITYLIVIEAESLEDMLNLKDSDLTNLDLIERVFLSEVGLRTLLPEEVEPDEGWPEFEVAQTADKQLSDPARYDECTEGQVPIDQTIGAHIEIVSLTNPDHRGVLADRESIDQGSDCSVILDADDSLNLEPFVHGPFEITVRLTLTPGENSYDLGGYMMTGVEGRMKVPSTLLDL